MKWSQDHVATYKVQVVRVAASLRNASTMALCTKPIWFEDSRFHCFNDGRVIPNHRALETQFLDFADYSSSCMAMSHLQGGNIAGGCK